MQLQLKKNYTEIRLKKHTEKKEQNVFDIETNIDS